jgi:hypothetical protein
MLQHTEHAPSAPASKSRSTRTRMRIRPSPVVDVTAPFPPNHAFNCHACGAAYREGVWCSLVLAETLEPLAVRESVLGWPDDICIEVRVCRCGERIALKRPWRIAAG